MISRDILIRSAVETGIDGRTKWVRQWIWVGTFVFCIVGCFYKMPVVKVSSGDFVTGSIRYVALGDSIAHGYGLMNPEDDSYVGHVRQYLEGEYDYVFAANLGTDGLRSDALLDILTNPENEKYGKYRATLEYADIVTVSIGSNDLLHLIELDHDMGDYIENGSRMFQEACRKFAVNFPKIIRAIHDISPKAEIYANNVYNPCHGVSAFAGIYDVSERYVKLLNETFMTADGFELVDIKERFDQVEENLLNMTIMDKRIDPHPNQRGHREIGSMVIQAIKCK